MLSAINEQIKNELESAYLYYSMVSYFLVEGFEGMAQWMKVQTQEEIFHAQKFFDYINERGGKVDLKPLNISKIKWTSPLDAFKDALKHEEFITSKINELMALAIVEKDYASQTFLDWYITEQVEEEANATSIIRLLERVGDSGNGLMMIDRELGLRVYTPPPVQGEAT
jgi:ferritin